MCHAARRRNACARRATGRMQRRGLSLRNFMGGVSMARSKATEANRLYWESDVSVAEIAQRLELSRRALYAAIQPLPAERNCERCGSPMTYENRSARAGDL